jgi:hypothetical protein
MEIYQIEERLNGTPYLTDTLSEPEDSLQGTDYWEIFSRENHSSLGKIENGKVRLYSIDQEEKSKLIKVLTEKKIPFKN